LLGNHVRLPHFLHDLLCGRGTTGPGQAARLILHQAGARVDRLSRRSPPESGQGWRSWHNGDLVNPAPLVDILGVIGRYRAHHRPTLLLLDGFDDRTLHAVTLLAHRGFPHRALHRVPFLTLMRLDDIANHIVAAIAHHRFINRALHHEPLFAH